MAELTTQRALDGIIGGMALKCPNSLTVEEKLEEDEQLSKKQRVHTEGETVVRSPISEGKSASEDKPEEEEEEVVEEETPDVCNSIPEVQPEEGPERKHTGDETILKVSKKRSRESTPAIRKKCRWVGTVSQLKSHLGVCPYETVTCSSPGCNVRSLRKIVQMHEKACPFRKIPCPNCAERVAVGQMSVHIADSCPESLVECKGCGLEVKRKDLARHELDSCPETTMFCVHYRHGCKTAFKRKNENAHYVREAVNHSKIISTKLDELERQIFELQRTNRELKSNLKVVWQGGFAFAEGTEIDCRDHVGMWLKAEVVKTERPVVSGGGGTRIFVHFENWDSRWDEWINADVDTYRFAPPGYYTSCNNVRANFKIGERVKVYITRPLPRSWRPAVVRKIHRQQVKVEYYSDGRRHEYWFHVKSMEIRHLPPIAPAPIRPGLKSGRQEVEDRRQEIRCVPGVEDSSQTARVPTPPIRAPSMCTHGAPVCTPCVRTPPERNPPARAPALPSVIPEDTAPSGEPLSTRAPLLLSYLPIQGPATPDLPNSTMPRTEQTRTPPAESKRRQCEGVGSRPMETHYGTNGPGLLQTLRGHEAEVWGCALSADGKLALSPY